ncbi:Reverse transcriptase [Theobroma cacao]|nr:Reverse transcriptase [Theobroma cacao]
MLKSIILLLAIATYHDYEIWKMNVKSAFLNGNLQEEVYMTQSNGFTSKEHANKLDSESLYKAWRDTRICLGVALIVVYLSGFRGAIKVNFIDEVYDLLEEMAFNNCQWPFKRAIPRRVAGVHELDAINALTTQGSSLAPNLNFPHGFPPQVRALMLEKKTSVEELLMQFMNGKEVEGSSMQSDSLDKLVENDIVVENSMEEAQPENAQINPLQAPPSSLNVFRSKNLTKSCYRMDVVDKGQGKSIPPHGIKQAPTFESEPPFIDLDFEVGQ